nr:odorant receptor 19 [Pachyrhinus yasumatsui]
MTEKIQILNFHVQILKLLFVWPKKCLTKTLNKLFTYGCFAFIISCNVPVVWAVAYQVSVGIDNLNIFIEALIGVFDIIGCTVVQIFLLKNQQIIAKIIEDINVFLKFCDKKVIKEIDEDCVRYTKYLLIYVTMGVILNLGWPLMSTEHCIISRGSEFYLKHDPCGMVTQHFYPFDASKPHVFWLLFVIETFYCYYICCEFSLGTATVVGLLMHIIAQVRNCGNKFQTVFNKDNDKLTTKARFVKCIKYHQAILEYSNNVCNIFNSMLIVYVTTTSCTLAVISYQIANPSTNMQDRIRYTMLLLGWLLLFFLICYYAQKLEHETVKIADSVYNSSWHDSHINIEMLKNITFIIARSQKPLTLEVRYMGTFSLVRYVSVLKTAYSFFTLLLTVTD